MTPQTEPAALTAGEIAVWMDDGGPPDRMHPFQFRRMLGQMALASLTARQEGERAGIEAAAKFIRSFDGGNSIVFGKDVLALEMLHALLPPAQPTAEFAIVPKHEAADAFWKYWNENGETHKHGYYESTWGAINAAIRIAGVRAHVYSAQPQEKS